MLTCGVTRSNTTCKPIAIRMRCNRRFAPCDRSARHLRNHTTAVAPTNPMMPPDAPTRSPSSIKPTRANITTIHIEPNPDATYVTAYRHRPNRASTNGPSNNNPAIFITRCTGP